jgi:hypothetical protein
LINAEVSQAHTLNASYTATIDLIRAMGGCYGGPDEQKKRLLNSR